MQVAMIRPIDRRREQILLYVRRSNAALGPDLDRPAMGGAALIHHCAFHELVERAKEESERSSARMAGTRNPVLVHFGPRFQIIDGPHAVPDAVVRQILAHE